MRPSRITVVLVAGFAPSLAHAQCSTPLAFDPIPTLSAHIGFPLDYNADLVPGANCGTILFSVVSGPPEFSIDGAGGLFYWTPATTGTKTITLRVQRLGQGQSATITFQAIVDDNSMSYPLFRDYLSQATNVPITGRARGAGFVSYAVDVRQTGFYEPPPPNRPAKPHYHVGRAILSRPSNRVSS